MNSKDLFLQKSIELITQLTSNYWLINGTLLGIVRDNNQIKWDNEIDVGVFADEICREDVIKLFISNNYKLIESNDSSDYINFSKDEFIFDINLFRATDKYFKSIWELEDFSIKERVINRIIIYVNFLLTTNIKKSESKKKVYLGYSIPKQFLFPLIEVSYKNFKVQLPNNSEKVLEHIYGQNWQIPNKNYNWILDGKNNAT